MRLEQLEYLADIAKTNSITITAQRFFVTQQAVSNNIRQLEDEVGATLLERNPHGVTLTQQGKLLTAFANRMLQDFQETKAQFRNDGGDRERSFIHMGSASLLNSLLMPKIARMLDRGKVEFIVNVREDTPESLLYKILNGEYDVGIMTLNASSIETLKSRENMKEIYFHVLSQDQLVACINAEGPFEKMDFFGEEEVNGYWKALCGIYPIAQYEKNAIDKSIICTNDVLLCRKLLLRKDLFVIMPQLIFSKFFKGKKFAAKPIVLPEKVVETHCLVYKESASENLKEFIKLTESCMRQI